MEFGKKSDCVVYSCDGVVLAAEGSLQIRTGRVILTTVAFVVEESYLDLTVRTTIPLEAVKSIRKRTSFQNTAKITLYKRGVSSTLNTIWEKKRRNFVFRDKRVLKLFVSAVKKSVVMEEEDAEEEGEGERGVVEVSRHLATTMTAKTMSLEDHLLLEQSAEFLRFVAGETIIPLGGTCEGIYLVDFGAVNVTDGTPMGLKGGVLTQLPVGSTFGELQFVVGSSLGETAIAADDDVVVKFWSKKELNILMENNLSFAAGFMGTISKTIRSRLIFITNKAAQEVAQETAQDSPMPQYKAPRMGGMGDSTMTDTIKLTNAKTYKCKMKKQSVAAQRGTLTVSTSGIMFSFRVFGLKTKVRTTFLDINKGEVSIRLTDLKGKASIEMTKGGEKFLYFGEKMRQAYEQISEARECIASATLGGSEDASLVLDDESPDLRPEDWAKILEISTQKKYEEGAVVVQEGESAHSVFQILNGSVSIQKKGGYSTKLHEGAVFGEMSFLCWFTEGTDAYASADVIANEKVDMICLEGRELSAVLLQDDSLCLRFFRYIVHLMSRRIEYTLPMECEWMKTWCPCAEIAQQSSIMRKKNLPAWLKEDMKLPSDIVDLYRDRLKSADFTTLQSLSMATDAELSSAGIAMIHRRKILWWVSQSENLAGEKREEGRDLYLVSWMRKEMMWPEDVIEGYVEVFGEEVTTVGDLKKLGIQDLVQMGIAPIHQRKISFWVATNH